MIKTLTLQYGCVRGHAEYSLTSRLHPLAVEDALRSSNSPRSKLDFYRSHLYLQILVQHLHRDDADKLEAETEDPLGGVAATDEQEPHLHGNVGTGPGLRRRRSAVGAGGRLQRLRDMFGGSRRRIMLPEGVEGVFEPSLKSTRGQAVSRYTRVNPADVQPYRTEAHRQTVNQLSARYMVPVRRGVMSVFMTRDGGSLYMYTTDF